MKLQNLHNAMQLNTEKEHHIQMNNNRKISTRIYSFLLSALMDGTLAMVQTCLPLLAIRFGAGAWFLGMLGWIPQAFRLPFCFTSGLLSDRIGRVKVLIPAAVIVLITCILLAYVRSNNQALIVYMMLMAAVGAYYPSLQAFIGDHSSKGELRKNLTSFNLGWTVGSSICGLAAGFLFIMWTSLPFIIGAALITILVFAILSWARKPVEKVESTDSSEETTADAPCPLLFIARTSHFLGFFGYALIRNIFPKLGIDLHIPESSVGALTAMMLVGEACGIFVAGMGPWWRGKLWPLILAQTTMLISGLLIFRAESPIAFGAAFFIHGLSLGIAYTGALYYGLQSRTNMGRNTGIHESLVASAIILGSLMGGTAGHFISLRAPYIIFSGIVLISVIISLIYWRTHRSEL